MKTICLCAAVFALTLANAPGQAKKLTNNPLTALPLSPATYGGPYQGNVPPIPQHSEDLSAATQTSKGGTPQASPEIHSLTTALSGQWSLSVKWEPDASNPNGLVNAGEETWKAGPGGYTLLEEEHLRMPKGRCVSSRHCLVEFDDTETPGNGMPKSAPVYM